MSYSGKKVKSIKTTMVALIIMGLLLPMVISSGWLSYNYYQKEVAGYETYLNRVATILGLGAQEALWNIDPVTLQPLIDAVAKDDRISKIIFYSAGGEVFAKLDKETSSFNLNSSEKISRSLEISKESEVIGRVEVEISLKPLHAEIQRKLIETMASTVFQIIVCLMLIIILINKIIVAKVQKLEGQASLLARKKLDEEFIWEEPNEIGSLGRSLESTRSSLKHLFENLEKIVEQRTETINTILNNVTSGFFLLDSQLKICEGYTKSCHKLLGDRIGEGVEISKALGCSNREAEHLSCCLNQVFEDIFPEEIAFGQVPDRAHCDGKALSIEGSAIRDKDKKISHILVTINDITSLEEAEDQNILNQAMIKILGQRKAFANYISDTRNQIGEARRCLTDNAKIKIILHTIKGNSAVFALQELVNLVHEMEEQKSFNEADLNSVEKCLREFLNTNREVLKLAYEEEKEGERSYEVLESHLSSLEGKLNETHLTDDVRKSILLWMWEIKKQPALVVFSTLEGIITRLSEKLYKNVKFEFIGERVLVDPDRLGKFVHVLPHVVRNSIDHGIEEPSCRGTKKSEGTIRFSIKDHDFYYWKIELEDDGQGIQTDKVVEGALKKGLVTEEQVARMSESERIALIFLGELSTAQEVTDISGRGIGMEAVKRCVDELDGRIEIESKIGCGTKFIFYIAKKSEKSEEVKTRAA